MPGVTSDETFVALCDWQGRLAWSSALVSELRIGEPLWGSLTGTSKAAVQNAVSRVVTLRESQVIEMELDPARYYRAWFWPLNSPSVAVCILAAKVANQLTCLTEREQQCLNYLSQGYTIQEIASRLDVSHNTLHTHLRRCRQKLGIKDLKALLIFAARNCPAADVSIAVEQPPCSKQI